jgi:HlyD family secretion protein
MNQIISNILISAALAAFLAACADSKDRQMVGTLERDRIEMVVESSEPIIAIHVQDGQAVSVGDPIISQDPERARNRLQQQTAERDQAAARLAELVRGPREETIREARAVLEASQAQTVNARANLERTREVYDRGLSREAQLDRDETRYKDAVAHEKASRESLERLLNGTTQEELQQAEAALRSAEQAVAQAELDLRRTRIVASVDGVVDKVLYRLGERPRPGATIAVVLDSARSFARIYVPEYLRSGFTPGKNITVRIDGVGDSFRGTVRWVSSDASFTPYFALTEHDRSRLSYLAEVDIPQASALPSGLPLVAELPAD